MSVSIKQNQPFFSCDALKQVIKSTVEIYPFLRHNLRAVNHFFNKQVHMFPLPNTYILELALGTFMHRMRKSSKLNGKKTARQ